MTAISRITMIISYNDGEYMREFVLSNTFVCNALDK